MLERIDLVDHVLFAVLTLVLGPRALITFRRLMSLTPEEQTARRPRTYRAAMISQWVLAAALIANWIVTARPWRSLGLAPLATGGAVGVLAGLTIIALVMMMQSRRAEGREAALARARERLRYVEFILPHTPSELRLFTALSVTAGICEELLYRGFMIWYLTHWTGEIQAALLSSLIFGFGHMYQGPRGILLTGAVGVFMSAVYLLSGSLYLPMLIHAVVDIHSGRIGFTLLQRASAEAGVPD